MLTLCMYHRVAVLVVSGLSFRANAFKECEEEASIPRSLLETRLKSAGKTPTQMSSNIRTSDLRPSGIAQPAFSASFFLTFLCVPGRHDQLPL